METTNQANQSIPSTSVKTSKLKKLKLILLIGIPLLLVLSLALLFSKSQQRKSKEYTEERLKKLPPAEEITDEKINPTPTPKPYEYYESHAPLNPNIVRAYADSTKKTPLVSGQAYSYPNPYFEWEGAQVKDEGTKIVGYLVSFGERHRVTKPMARVEEAFFSPNQYGIILEKGQTYKLFVQSVSNGQDHLGFDRETKKAAISLFEYIFQ